MVIVVIIIVVAALDAWWFVRRGFLRISGSEFIIIEWPLIDLIDDSWLI